MKVYLHPNAPFGTAPASPPPPRLPELTGTMGVYLRGKKLGEGGMGEVFRGTDGNGSPVILKFISLRAVSDQMKKDGLPEFEIKEKIISFLIRFLNEVEFAGMVRHPNLTRALDANIRLAIPGFDDLKNIFRRDPKTGEYCVEEYSRHRRLIDFDLAGIEGKDIFIAFEFVPESAGSERPAPTLSDSFSRGTRVSLPVIKLLFMPVFELLAKAHAAGVVHRDLKPDNFLVTEKNGRPFVKVIDLGIGREISEERKTRLTKVGHLIGTPYYVPPYDYKTAAEADPSVWTRFDIYSMGMVLFEMMTGMNPLEGLSLARMLAAKACLEGFNFNLIEDPKARAIIRKMLSPDWKQNYASMQEVISAWKSI